MCIHENIKKLREQKKISQEYVSYKLGLSQSQYSRREKGEIKFLADEIAFLSKILETPVSLFFDEHISNSPVMFNQVKLEEYAFISTKLVEQYEARLKEKDELIKMLQLNKHM